MKNWMKCATIFCVIAFAVCAAIAAPDLADQPALRPSV
jgi:hypothetical protein